MTDKHLSTQFDAELSGISTRVLEMGGLVESQVAQAVEALGSFSGDIASHVLKQEEIVNTMEIEIDRDLSTIIARRQPTARDLRLLIAELKNDYTVVIVTHNMQQAARCSDYTAYMYLGDLIEVGETEQIFFKPQRRETEDYITGRFG